MNFIYKIFLFSFLSFSFPVGRLFEMFIWNDRVTKTESVFWISGSETKGKFCLFIKVYKKIKAKLSVSILKKYDYLFKEINQNTKITQALMIQKNCFDELKNRFIRIQVFNITYSDVPWKDKISIF